MAELLKLDWSTAAVAGDTLTVELAAEPPKEWREAFEGTAVLLDSRHWKVAISKQGAIKVAGIGAGDEDDVRQFLEGSVLQANSTLTDEDELFGREPAEHEEESDEADEPDAEAGPTDEDLTERFRSFSAGDDAASDDSVS